MNDVILRPGVAAIHIGCSPAMARSAERDCLRTNALVFRFNVSGFRDKTTLIGYLASGLKVPYRVRYWDALVDLGSDLSWFGKHWGCLFVFDGADLLPPDLLEKLVSLLPDIADRNRGGGRAFLALLIGTHHVGPARAVLEVQNRRLRAARAQSWDPGTDEVEVIDHTADP